MAGIETETGTATGAACSVGWGEGGAASCGTDVAAEGEAGCEGPEGGVCAAAVVRGGGAGVASRPVRPTVTAVAPPMSRATAATVTVAGPGRRAERDSAVRPTSSVIRCSRSDVGRAATTRQHESAQDGGTAGAGQRQVLAADAGLTGIDTTSGHIGHLRGLEHAT